MVSPCNSSDLRVCPLQTLASTEHQSDTKDYFSLLPDELIGKIFDKCNSPRTTVNLGMVSHRFRVLVTNGMTVQTALGFIKINPMFYFSPTIQVNNSLKNDDNVIVTALKRSPELFISLTGEQQNNLLFRQIAWFSSQVFGKFDLGTRLLGDQFSNWFPGKTEEDVCADRAAVDLKDKDRGIRERQQYLFSCKEETGFAPCLDDIEVYRMPEFPWRKYPKSDCCLKTWCSVDGLSLHHASDAQKNNPEIIMVAVRQNGHALQYASAELQKDREIVMTAVRQNGDALQYASAELQNDREIVMVAARQNGHALQYASAELQKDREIVMVAVRQNGFMLMYASDRLKNDREIVMTAVRENGYALPFASDRLKNDKEIVLEAVRQEGRALQFASDELQHDKDVVLAAGESARVA